MASLEARNVGVEYTSASTGRRVVALEGVELHIPDGAFVCIVGMSGCGKSTLLNAIDGLVKVTSGELLLNGKPISGPGPERAMVFQHAALLPWRNVEDNVKYGLELQRRHKNPSDVERVRRLVSLVGLAGFEKAYPGELSGGMAQRANIARALAVDPDVLLLDEPTSGLDAQMRERMQEELMRIWEQSHKTSVFVTHQIDEAIYLADLVVVMSARPGRVREVIEIDLPRPRPLSIKRDSRFIDYMDHVAGLIEEEHRRSGAASVGATA
ncbi:ABC transporter ATP-binding protein [Nocardioides sp. KR10-350]|uniref:ABC transporter ATP-binding protein n=1 Tax=Nocardioides cheoyonin TaxID=3156615 RepID=UPI0032B49219